MIHLDGETERIRQAIAKGDLTVFWEIWENNRNRFLKICMLQFSDRAKAEDALSGIMLKAVEVLPKYAPKIQNFQSWLTRLAYNYCHDIHREESRYRFSDDLTDKVTTEDDSATDPEIRFFEKQTKDNVDKLLAGLSPSLRSAFMLRFYGGLSYREISKRAGVREVSIRKRIQRARNILREHLGSRSIKEIAVNHLKLSSTDRVKTESLEMRPKSPVDLLGPEPLLLRFTRVRMDSGAMVDMPIALEHKPTRLAMKIQTLRRHVSRYPGGWKKRLELAELLYVSGAWDRAIHMYKMVLKRNPQLQEVRVQLGLVFLEMDRKVEAEKVFQVLLDELSPAAEPGWANYIEGQLQLCRGDFENARMFFVRALSADPERGRYQRTLGRIQEQMERYREALRYYDKAIECNPRDILAMTRALKSCERLGLFDEAKRRAKSILKLDQENVLALKFLADDRCRRGLVNGKEGTKTRRLIRAMLKTGKLLADVHDSLANYHIARGSLNDGLERLRHYVRDHPQNPSGWHYFARRLFQTGRQGGSVRAIRHAVSLAGKDPDIMKTACRILNTTGKHEALRPLVKNMVRFHGHRWSTWVILAQILTDLPHGRGRALKASRLAVQMHPDMPDTWLHHALLLYRIGERDGMSAAILKGWTLLGGQSPTIAAEASLRMVSLAMTENDEQVRTLWHDRAERLITRLANQVPPLGREMSNRLDRLLRERDMPNRCLEESAILPFESLGVSPLWRLGSDDT